MWEKHLFTDRSEVKSFTQQFDCYDQWEFQNYANCTAGYCKTNFKG